MISGPLSNKWVHFQQHMDYIMVWGAESTAAGQTYSTNHLQPSSSIAGLRLLRQQQRPRFGKRDTQVENCNGKRAE